MPSGALAQSGASIKLTLSNQDTVRHDWVLVGSTNNTIQKLSADPGQNAVLEFTAPPTGIYTFKCDIANYAQLGMTGNLTVR
jgi:plastocyanin